MKNIIINKKKIIFIEPAEIRTNNIDTLYLIIKDGGTIHLDVNDLSRALTNAKNFLNKSEQFFTLSEFDYAVNEKYQPGNDDIKN